MFEWKKHEILEKSNKNAHYRFMVEKKMPERKTIFEYSFIHMSCLGVSILVLLLLLLLLMMDLNDAMNKNKHGNDIFCNSNMRCRYAAHTVMNHLR